MIRSFASLLGPILLLLFLSILVKTALHKSQMEVVSKNGQKTFASYKTLIPPPACLDPAYQPLFYNFVEIELSKTYSQFVAEMQQYYGRTVDDPYAVVYNSEVTALVLDSVRTVSDVIGKRKFRSLFDLNAYLLLVGRNDLEYKCIEFYIRKIVTTDELTFFGGDDSRYFSYLCYLQKYYMTPIDQLIKQKQFDRAKALSEQLLKRIKLVDTFALNKTNIDSRARVNKSYLLSLLLADTYQCYLASNYINNLIPTFSADQSLSISNELGGDQKAYETAGLSEGYDVDLTSRFTVNITHRLDRDLDTLVLSEYKSYWKGIKLFRAKQFDESAKEFNRCRGKAKNNILLHDLCSIWLARSYIWKQLKQHSENKKETLATLRKLQQEITLPNLASDIADYINYLEVAAKQ